MTIAPDPSGAGRAAAKPPGPPKLARHDHASAAGGSRLGARRSVASVIAERLDGRRRSRLAVDAFVLYLASAAALLPVLQSGAQGVWLAAVFPVLVVAMLQDRRARDDRLNWSLLDALTKVLTSVSCATVVMIALDSLIGGQHAVAFALRLWLFAAVFLGAVRVLLLTLRTRLQRTGALSTPTLIVGAGLVGEHLVLRLLGEPRYGLRPVGFLDADPLPRPEGSVSRGVPLLGGLGDIARAIEQTGAQRVILAFSTEPDEVLVDKVRECEKLGVDVSLVPRLYELINDRASLDRVGGLPLLSLHSIDPSGWQFAIKHALDRGIALLALLVLAPLMGAIALAVRRSSPGPVMLRQRRTGRDGKQFDLLKFRTMRVATGDAGGYHPPAAGDAPGGVEGEDRRTRVGRLLRELSLDELPQFINVLRGQMSLVGPRPERPEYVARFTRNVSRYRDRHRVKSGITGWAQVHGLRGQTSIADRVEWDNYYIQNWTVRLDLRILALTVLEVLHARKDGSDPRDDVSAPPASLSPPELDPALPRAEDLETVAEVA